MTIAKEAGFGVQNDDLDSSSDDSFGTRSYHPAECEKINLAVESTEAEQIENALIAILQDFHLEKCTDEGMSHIADWLETFGLAPVFDLLKEIGGCSDDRENVNEVQKWVEKFPWSVHEIAFGSLRQLLRACGTDGVTLEDVQALLQPVYFEGVEEILNPVARAGPSEVRQGLYLTTRIPPGDPKASHCLLRPKVRDSLASIQDIPLLPLHSSYQIRPSPSKGMGMFASHNIESNQVVLLERPMVVLPDMLLFLDRRLNPDPDPNQILEDYRESILQSLFQEYAERKEAFESLYRCKETKNVLNDIFQTNAILLTGLVDPDRARVSKAGSGHGGVFEHASRINHSCDPNVKLNFDYDVFGLEVRALRDIEEGEELMFTYAGAGLESAKERRLLLKAYWGFVCQCSKCALSDLDPE